MGLANVHPGEVQVNAYDWLAHGQNKQLDASLVGHIITEAMSPRINPTSEV
jgi:hypothetical protein